MTEPTNYTNITQLQTENESQNAAIISTENADFN